MVQNVQRLFGGDRRGVTSLEYAIMASLIAVAIFASLTGAGGSLGTLAGHAFGAISNQL